MVVTCCNHCVLDVPVQPNPRQCSDETIQSVTRFLPGMGENRDIINKMNEGPDAVGGHRTIHKSLLHWMDAKYKRLLRCVVGPPPTTSWQDPWHEIPHGWNTKVRKICCNNSIVYRIWKLATHLANLLNDRKGEAIREMESQARTLSETTQSVGR